MANVLDCNKCNAGGFNPKKSEAAGKRKNKSVVRWMDIGDPIPAEIKDADFIANFFKEFPFVPYATADNTTGHSFLRLINNLSELSVTQAACRNTICRHTFGGKIKVVEAFGTVFENLGIDSEEEYQSVDNSTFDLIVNLTSERITFSCGDIRHFFKEVYEGLHRNGNAWVEVRRYFVAGVPYAHVHIHKAEEVLYMATEKDQPRFVAVSPYWDYWYLKKKPFSTLPVFPQWGEDNDAEVTMMHFKTGDQEWYGRPLSLPGLVYQYREWQDSMYLTKQAAANFVGQVLMEFEGNDPESGTFIDDERDQAAGYGSTADRIEKNFTFKGDDPSSVFVTERPYGTKPAFVFQFKPNTSHAFYKEVGKIAEDKIILANSWSRRLSGLDVSAGMNTEAYIQEMRVKSHGVLADWKNEVSAAVNKVMNEVLTHVAGGQDMTGISLIPSSPYEKLMREIRQENA